MDTEEEMPGNQLNVLVVGNNPIELGEIFEILSKIKGKRLVSQMAFDLKTAVERLETFQPQFILIDDNVGRGELTHAMNFFSQDKRTREIPITVLKNSNYHEAIDRGILNYVLKENITGETLYTELINSLRLKKTQQYLYNAYRKRKGQLLRMLKSQPAV